MHPLAKKHFEKIIKFGKPIGQNKNCRYFPCHDELEDCTFCYCPIYPCLKEERGGYWLKTNNRKVWACEKCVWIHKKENAKKLLKILYNESNRGNKK